ncbi:hypothetical protein FHG87_010133 [Trinorchestia longiramus]|nr:hypothetical protein FHG87_010133 [Trinorchestia longiramus]
MHFMINHPVLQEMLSAKCCTEKSVGLGFALYSSLCEGYRLGHLGWRCDRALNLIYVVTSSSEALQTSPPSVVFDGGLSMASKRSKTHPQNEQKKFAGLELPQENSQSATSCNKVEKNKREDCKTSKGENSKCLEKQVSAVSSKLTQSNSPTGNESHTDCASSSEASKSEDSVTAEVKVAIKLPEDKFVQEATLDDEHIACEVDECVELVCVPVLCDLYLEDSFLQRLHSMVKQMYPHAELSLVPMDRWRVLGNYTVTPGIDDSGDVASSPTNQTIQKSTEQTLKGNTSADADIQTPS